MHYNWLNKYSSGRDSSIKMYFIVSWMLHPHLRDMGYHYRPQRSDFHNRLPCDWPFKEFHVTYSDYFSKHAISPCPAGRSDEKEGTRASTNQRYHEQRAGSVKTTGNGSGGAVLIWCTHKLLHWRPSYVMSRSEAGRPTGLCYRYEPAPTDIALSDQRYQTRGVVLQAYSAFDVQTFVGDLNTSRLSVLTWSIRQHLISGKIHR